MRVISLDDQQAGVCVDLSCCDDFSCERVKCIQSNAVVSNKVLQLSINKFLNSVWSFVKFHQWQIASNSVADSQLKEIISVVQNIQCTLII